MRTTYLFNIIIVCLAFIISLFTIKTNNVPYSGYSEGGYAYNNITSNDAVPATKNISQTTEIHPQIKYASMDEKVPAGEEKTATAGAPAMTESFYYEMGDVRLSGEAGSLKEKTELTIDGIDTNVLPPMNAGMVNVTADYAAYRMLPHGMIFNKDIEVVLPYDTTLLPMGFTANDIMTYYYDEQYGRWIEIERDSVDMVNHLIISRVNHFTDFINAVIKTPEMPETSAYVPTTMSDIKAANPLEGINLMQPPTANNNGTANMNYPIEIPAGRNGMQPNLALTYNSGGGNGWLGVGWDISIPAITVETRWGVPRYNASLESEVYVLSGEQLVTKDSSDNFNPMPHRTNVWQSRMPEGTQFYPRVNEVFDSIVRHGTNPTNYWWSVTDRNGITNYYGKQHGTDAMDPNSVLRDASGNIAHWALTESVDPYGNNVRYYYDIVYNDGIQGSNFQGKQIYIQRINYTGLNNQSGEYEVVFTRRPYTRSDMTISAKYGFKEVTSELLCNVCSRYNNELFSCYFFYTENCRASQYKTRLIDLIEMNVDSLRQEIVDELCSSGNVTGGILDNQNIARYHFDYYDAPSGNAMFGSAVPQTFNTIDNIQSHFITGAFNGNGQGKATALGATKGKSWSLGGTAAVGVGLNVCMTSVSLGGNFDYSRSKSEGILTMIDLDGDGLSDKVFKDGNTIKYRKQIASSGNSFTFSTTAYPIEGVSDFLEEVSSTTTWGLQASAGLSYSGSWPKTTSTTTTYFSDVNADGLPDLITEDGVLFNTTQKNGRVTFQSFYSMVDSNIANNVNPNQVVIPSTSTCGGIIFDGKVNDSIACEVALELDSTIEIKDSAALMNAYALMDSLINTGEYECILDSLERANYRLRIFKKTVHCEPMALDPDMDAVKVWVAPKDGFINIHSDFRLLEDTSVSRQQSKYVDGVRYTIQLDGEITMDTNLLSSLYSEELYSQVVAEDDYERYEVDTTIYVNGGDVIFFRLQSQGNRSFDRVNWEQTIEYETYNGNIYSNYDIYGINEDYYNSQHDFVITGKEYFQAHKNGVVKITTNILTGNYLYDESRLEITYHQCGHSLYTKKIITLQPNMNYIDVIPYFCTEQYDSITFYVKTLASSDPTWSNVRIQPKIEYLYFDTSSTSIVRLDTIYYYPPVNLEIENYIGTPKDSLYHNLFGPLYRGWGQFAYNNNDTSLLITDPIDINTLAIDKIKTSSNPDDTLAIYRSPSVNDESSQEDATASYDSQDMYHPLSSKTRWIQMSANSQYWAWVGYGNINYITDTMMTNTRMPEFITVAETSDIPEYDHPVPQSLSENYEVKTVRKRNRSELKNHSLNASIPIVPISLGISSSKGSNTILSDYMDLNGDRYPDIMGPVNVQYSMPWGGIGNTTPLDVSLQNISISSTNSSGTNFGASYSMPTRGISNNPKNAKISFDGRGSISANIGDGTDNTDIMWMDMNGDGLPDRVNSGGDVALNLGYKFLPFERWNQGNIRSGSSSNSGISLGLGSINIAQASIGGGLSINKSENTTNKMLMDFNGDGLPDKVSKSGNSLIINYNLGNGSFSSAETVNIDNISYGTSFSESANLSGTLGFTLFGFLKVTVGIQGSPYNRSFNKDREQLIDINGDGYIDYVTSSAENSMYVKYNQTGKANLLKQVTNFTGSKIEMDYEMPLSSFEQSQRSWVMSSVRTEDPYTPAGGGVTLTTFDYRNPHYDRYERIAYGYDTVFIRQRDTENNNSVYRYTVQGYNNDNFFKRGKKKSETIFDSIGRPFIETLYDLVLVDLSDTTIIGDYDCPAYCYPKYESEIKNYFEGQPTAQVTTKKSFQYDNHRNVIKYINFGDTTINDDNLRADISYKKGMGYNLIALTDTIKVYNQSGNLLRKRTASYNVKGKMTQIRQYNGSAFSVIDITYENNYGNIDRITFPPNNNNQRMYYEYDFDQVVHSYPVQVTSALGYYSTATYDYRWENL